MRATALGMLEDENREVRFRAPTEDEVREWNYFRTFDGT